VLYVSTGGSGTACSDSNPCSIATAVGILNLVQDVILIEPGVYSESIDIPENVQVLVSGYGATLTGLNSDGEVVEIHGGAHVRVLGLNLVASGSANFGLAINLEQDPPVPVVLEDLTIDSVSGGVDSISTQLSLSRSRIHAELNSSIAAALPGSVLVDRSQIDGAGVVVVFAGELNVTNSIVGPMLPSNSSVTNAGGALSVAFSTIYDSPIACGSSAPDCTSGSGQGICFDSVIIYSDLGTSADTMTGSACTSAYTLVFPQSTPITGSNNLLGENPLLVSPGSGNFHLLPNSPAIGAADPSATDTHDFDGSARPHGSADIGAFEH
jgi:hypothetical protein